MDTEQAIFLTERKVGFEKFMEALPTTLRDFLSVLKINTPETVFDRAPELLESVSKAVAILGWQTESTYYRFQVGVAQYVGEYFRQRYHGKWYVNEIVDGKHFGRPVVGRFLLAENVEIAPVDFALEFVNRSIPRDLSKEITEVEEAIANHLRRGQTQS